MRIGDTIAVVAPASLTARVRIDAGLESLDALGFRAELLLPEASGPRPYLAGPDPARAELLTRALMSERYSAVWCLRGGFGCVRTLAAMDLDILRSSTKPLIGFSDITALLLQKRHGSFHGPVVTQLPNLDAASLGQLEAMLTGAAREVPLDADVRVYKPGVAEGPLCGGNLAVLSSLVGTPYLPSLDGTILFLEDVGEPPYRIDRMLCQLRLAGALEGVRGLCLGRFTGIAEPERSALDALFEEVAGWIGGPVVRGLPVGHAAENVTIPMWRTARLDTESGRLVLAR